MPLLNDALQLAAWLAGNRADADDIVQEAMLRAYRYLDRFSGAAFRPWLLAIVRNTAMTWLKRNRSSRIVLVPDYPSEDSNPDVNAARVETPEDHMLQRDRASRLNQAVAALPDEFRE